MYLEPVTPTMPCIVCLSVCTTSHQTSILLPKRELPSLAPPFPFSGFFSFPAVSGNRPMLVVYLSSSRLNTKIPNTRFCYKPLPPSITCLCKSFPSSAKTKYSPTYAESHHSPQSSPEHLYLSTTVLYNLSTSSVLFHLPVVCLFSLLLPAPAKRQGQIRLCNCCIYYINLTKKGLEHLLKSLIG